MRNALEQANALIVRAFALGVGEHASPVELCEGEAHPRRTRKEVALHRSRVIDAALLGLKCQDLRIVVLQLSAIANGVYRRLGEVCALSAHCFGPTLWVRPRSS